MEGRVLQMGVNPIESFVNSSLPIVNGGNGGQSEGKTIYAGISGNTLKGSNKVNSTG